MLSVGPTKSVVNSQNSRYSCRCIFAQSIKVPKLMKENVQHE